MKTLSVILVIMNLMVVSGCGASVQTYTFEVERADQELAGNRGYIGGEAPAEETKARKTTRTWVGVDVELPTRDEFIEETGLKINK